MIWSPWEIWCQNDFRTQDNSILLLTIGNDWNIIKYHGGTSKFSMVDMKVTTTLKPHGWPAPDITVRKNLQFDIAKCTTDSIII